MGIEASSQITISEELMDGKMLYGTCETDPDIQEKTSSISDFTLYSGVVVAIKFTNTNTASNPTLNIRNTGAKSIKVMGSPMTSAYYWSGGDTVMFVYDGNNDCWNTIDSTSLKNAETAISKAKQPKKQLILLIMLPKQQPKQLLII